VTDVVVLTVAGVAVGWAVRRLLQPVFELPLLARENYRGRSVATAAGVVIPIALVVVEAGRVLLASLDVGQPLTSIRAMVLVAALGFGLLGLIDDLVGSGHARGFRGHLGELARGRLTTGGLKLVGGIAVAVIIGGARNPHSPGRLLADAALIALAANLANQLDRRPGRVTKVAVVAFVVLVAFAADHASLASIGVVIGAAVALFYDDLRERLMLGDVGANVVGACLGVGVVIAYSFPVRLAVLAVVAVLNLVGELSSFTRLIDAVPPLRALDRAGRRDP
jgi:UDP-GlcNAc:undecaprenyl-phosphate/decaprenyl-phosphate GlcNAc-1-phosphate transferase